MDTSSSPTTAPAGAASTATTTRAGGRRADQLRDVHFVPDFIRNAFASVLVEVGGTRLICTASVDETVPRWMYDEGAGWVTAEYAMLPASTGQRKSRDSRRGRPDGRSIEIQRLIGRSLRAVVDRHALGQRTVTIDCDVIDADGGTRCAAICGGYVALHRAMAVLVERGDVPRLPLTDTVAAVSVGIVDGVPLLDLQYSEDSIADVDMNLVMTGGGDLIEVQASAEGATFSRDEFDVLMALASGGCAELMELQRAACEA